MSFQGTLNWMAPEVTQKKGYSAKVDIWSLGCLCLEMLTGVNPWFKVRGNIVYLLGTGHAPPIPANIGDSARQFLDKCLTLDPEQRPTAEELLTERFCNVEDIPDFAQWVSEREQLESEESDSEGGSYMGSEYEDSDTDLEMDNEQDASDPPSRQGTGAAMNALGSAKMPVGSSVDDDDDLGMLITSSMADLQFIIQHPELLDQEPTD